LGTIREALGFNLKLLRKQKGMNQDDWAAFLDIPRRTYVRYELGETFPQDEHMVQILAKLEVEEDELVQLPIGRPRLIRAAEPTSAGIAHEESWRTLLVVIAALDKDQVPHLLENARRLQAEADGRRGHLIDDPVEEPHIVTRPKGKTR
jgi:transcriptional regulator with XRE-family HTH domain